MKARFISRVWLNVPFLTLCTTEAMFKHELKRLKFKEELEFVPHGRDACVRTFNYKGKKVVIVNFKPHPKHDMQQVAGLMAHEAMHVWQRFRDEDIYEKPSPEVEAYCVQHLVQCLLNEYERQTKPKKVKK